MCSIWSLFGKDPLVPVENLVMLQHANIFPILCYAIAIVCLEKVLCCACMTTPSCAKVHVHNKMVFWVWWRKTWPVNSLHPIHYTNCEPDLLPVHIINANILRIIMVACWSLAGVLSCLRVGCSHFFISNNTDIFSWWECSRCQGNVLELGTSQTGAFIEAQLRSYITNETLYSAT